MTTEKTIEAIVIYQCAECDVEIKRKTKIYSLNDFLYMTNCQPNFYYQDSSTKEYFIIVRPICETCQT